MKTQITLLTAASTATAFTVGMLPSLGWNSWNAVHCDVNETVVLNAAKSFVSLGLKDAGYEFVNIDDCWSIKNARDSEGRIQPDLTKFPDGIDGLAEKVKAMGLKLGIYSDAGTETCAGFPGSLGNEMIDAETFAGWGVQYLKYDNCNIPSNWTDASSYPDWSQSNSFKRYQQMSQAIASLPSDQTFVFNLCIWGTAHVTEWGAQLGESWRMSGDIEVSWDSMIGIVGMNVPLLDAVDFFAHNDMDMMEIGNGMSIQEERTHMAMWSAMKSPILLGTDLSKLSSEQLSIVKNPELLSFSQDSTIGTPAKPFNVSSSPTPTSPPEFYAGQSSIGTHVFIINTGSAATNKSFMFSEVPGLSSGGMVLVHDMWTGSDVGTFDSGGSFEMEVESHDTVALRITSA